MSRSLLLLLFLIFFHSLLRLDIWTQGLLGLLLTIGALLLQHRQSELIQLQVLCLEDLLLFLN